MVWMKPRPSLFPGKPEEDGEKIFTISEKAMLEIKAWKEEHNQKCEIPEWMAFFTPTSKYTYEFCETGLGDNPRIRCQCGEKFYPPAASEDL